MNFNICNIEYCRHKIAAWKAGFCVQTWEFLHSQAILETSHTILCNLFRGICSRRRFSTLAIFWNLRHEDKSRVFFLNFENLTTSAGHSEEDLFIWFRKFDFVIRGIPQRGRAIFLIFQNIVTHIQDYFMGILNNFFWKL